MKRLTISLKIKTICCVILGAFILSCVAVWIGYTVYSDTMDNHYRNMTMNLAKTESAMLDKELTKALTEDVMEIYRKSCEEYQGTPNFEEFSETDWENYYAKYDEVINSEVFQDVLAQIHAMAEVNDVMSMYICYMDEVTNKAVYIIDGTLTDDICLPGTCDDIEDGNKTLMEQGIYEFPAYITNYEEYGWLCSASAGIYDENGTLIANAYVDISMDEVMMERQAFLQRLGVTLLLITVVLVAILGYVLQRTIVHPVNLLAEATSSFVSEKEKHGSDNEASAISKLQIHSGDEIEKLAESIKKMEHEINTYIDNLTRITAEKERIGAELNVATQIQADMLPNIFPAFPERPEFDIYAYMTPAKEVGGDFYDFFMVDDRHLAIVIADVSGKGVPAALFMVIAKTLIKDHTTIGKDLGGVFTEVNNLLCESNNEGFFVTAFEGVLDLVTGEFRFVNAGHEIPYICKKDGTFEPYKVRAGFVLAGMEGVRYRAGSIMLEEGDKLFQYTDGVPEATNSSEELYGNERLHQILKKNSNKTPKEILGAVKEDVDKFVGEADPFDDLTMLCLEYKKHMGEKELTVKATIENIPIVTEFVEAILEEAECDMKTTMQISIAIDEIFGNIAQYAYPSEVGEVTIKIMIMEQPQVVCLTFADNGIPYNPLEKSDPDTTLSAEERVPGGLGIYMVKKSMDEVSYEYKGGQNIFKLKKKF